MASGVAPVKVDVETDALISHAKRLPPGFRRAAGADV